MARHTTRTAGRWGIVACGVLIASALVPDARVEASCAVRHYAITGRHDLDGTNPAARLGALFEAISPGRRSDRPAVPPPSPCAGMRCAGDPIPPLTAPASSIDLRSDRAAGLFALTMPDLEASTLLSLEPFSPRPVDLGSFLFRPPR